MKYFLIIITLFIAKLNAQEALNFDKRFVQCEDKWVAFKPNKDSVYDYGFIYIDAAAGLTLNYEGSFKILPTGEFVPKKVDRGIVKVRLEPNNVLVAFIPDGKFQELKIDAVPDWLKDYKTDTNSVERLYRWGYMYNGWNECAKALTFLERAEKISPEYKGLAVELSFSYNCLEQYDKAEAILEKEIKNNSSDAYVNKEYIYTLTKNNKIDKAKEAFNVSLKALKDTQYNAENCYNILQYYYFKKDKTNFSKWYTEFLKHPSENKRMIQYADKMKMDIEK